MTIPSVVQGMVEVEGGKVFELDSPKGSTWLESVTSFRYEPTGASKPYTVRKEPKKGGDYWYAYRKVAGKLHKRYIGRDAELTIAKLEEIAETLNTPQQARVPEMVTKKVTETVTETVADDELPTVLTRVQALEDALKALQSKPLEEIRLGDTDEALKPNVEVTQSQLLNSISNLNAENEALRQELTETKQQYLSLLDNSAERVKELQAENEALRQELADEIQSHVTQFTIRKQLQAELEVCKQQSVVKFELPEPADLLNWLKANRKKATASLADVEAILGRIEESNPDGGN